MINWNKVEQEGKENHLIVSVNGGMSRSKSGIEHAELKRLDVLDQVKTDIESSDPKQNIHSLILFTEPDPKNYNEAIFNDRVNYFLPEFDLLLGTENTKPKLIQVDDALKQAGVFITPDMKIQVGPQIVQYVVPTENGQPVIRLQLVFYDTKSAQEVYGKLDSRATTSLHRASKEFLSHQLGKTLTNIKKEKDPTQKAKDSSLLNKLISQKKADLVKEIEIGDHSVISMINEFDKTGHILSQYIFDIRGFLLKRVNFSIGGTGASETYFDLDGRTRLIATTVADKTKIDDIKADAAGQKLGRVRGSSNGETLLEGIYLYFDKNHVTHHFSTKMELDGYVLNMLNNKADDVRFVLDRTNLSEYLVKHLKTDKPLKAYYYLHNSTASDANASRNGELTTELNNNFYFGLANPSLWEAILSATPEQAKDVKTRFPEAHSVEISVGTVAQSILDRPKIPILKRLPHSVVAVSRLVIDKRQDHAIRMIAEAKKSIPDITFDLFGPHNFVTPSQIIQLIKNSERIKTLPTQTNNLLTSQKAFDAFKNRVMLTSLDPKHSHDFNGLESLVPFGIKTMKTVVALKQSLSHSDKTYENLKESIVRTGVNADYADKFFIEDLPLAVQQGFDRDGVWDGHTPRPTVVIHSQLDGLAAVNRVEQHFQVFTMTSIMEGFNLAKLEAATNGLAAISYNENYFVHSQSSDILVPYAEPYGDWDDSSFVKASQAGGQALVQLFSDDKLLQRYSNGAYELAGKYSVKNIAKQWESLLKY